MIVSILLRAAAVVLLALLAFQVIDTHIFEWLAGGIALGFAADFPWPA